MITEVTELVKSLQTLAQEATAYYQRLNGAKLPNNVPWPTPENVKAATQPVAATASTAVEPIAEEKKRGRPKKEKTPESEAPKPAAVPTMTEDQSATEVLETAKQYVQRFQKETPDGMTRAKKIIADHYKATRLAELKHDQRVDLIAILRAEMEAAG